MFVDKDFPWLVQRSLIFKFPALLFVFKSLKGCWLLFLCKCTSVMKMPGKNCPVHSSPGIICSDDEWCPDCNLSVVCVNSICVCLLSAVIHMSSALLCSLPAWNCLSGVTLIFWALLSHTVSQYRVMVSECVPRLPQVLLETELIMPFPSTLSVTVV